MKSTFRVLLLFILLPYLSSCSGTALKNDWHRAPLPAGFTQTLVSEPVFKSRCLVIEGGSEKAETVLLVHGLGDRAADTWRPILQKLAKNYHVVTFDLPGFGRSEKKNALYSPANYAAFVNWAIERYAKGPFSLVGHSLGGAIALYCAGTSARQPERLIMVDVAGILHQAAILRHMLHPRKRQSWPLSLPFRLFDKMILSTDLTPTWLPVYTETLLDNEELRSKILKGNPSRIAAIALIQTDFNHVLPTVKSPTLILWGEDDTVTPLRTGIALEGTIEDARLQLIAGAGHAPMLDQPEAFALTILDFLGGRSEPAPPAAQPPEKREGLCRNESNVTFTGNYKTIRIADCKNVRLESVTAESVQISNSTVTIQKTAIRGKKTGLIVKNSIVTATALSVEADHALETSGSTYDLAATRLIGGKTAIRSEDQDSFIFSISLAKSHLVTRYLHGKLKIIAQTPL